MNSPLSSSGRHHLSALELSPNKPQWALMNDYKVLQNEKERQDKKNIQKEKQKIFREYLDKQIESKNEIKYKQKQTEQQYYEEVVKRDDELKEKEVNKKYNEFQRYKNYANDNKRLLDIHKTQKQHDDEIHGNFDIGARTLQEQKLKKERAKKQIVDSLDQQLMFKAQQKERQKNLNRSLDQATLEYQIANPIGEKKKNPYNSQNQLIYQHYDELMKEKQMKKRAIDYKLVDKAREQKISDEQAKLRQKRRQKSLKNEELKQYLDYQVNNRKKRIEQERKASARQNSYSMLGSLFRQRSSPYDKKQYSEYLKRQAQLRKQKEKKVEYMTEEQYRINMNQLNKAINGSYNYNGYVDRSINSLGDSNKIKKDHLSIQNNDSRIIGKNLNTLKEGSTGAEEKSVG